jgi:hypothetical protein
MSAVLRPRRPTYPVAGLCRAAAGALGQVGRVLPVHRMRLEGRHRPPRRPRPPRQMPRSAAGAARRSKSGTTSTACPTPAVPRATPATPRRPSTTSTTDETPAAAGESARRRLGCVGRHHGGLAAQRDLRAVQPSPDRRRGFLSVVAGTVRPWNLRTPAAPRPTPLPDPDGDHPVEGRQVARHAQRDQDRVWSPLVPATAVRTAPTLEWYLHVNCYNCAYRLWAHASPDYQCPATVTTSRPGAGARTAATPRAACGARRARRRTGPARTGAPTRSTTIRTACSPNARSSRPASRQALIGAASTAASPRRGSCVRPTRGCTST